MLSIGAFEERDEVLPVGLRPVVQGRGHGSVLLVPFEIRTWSPWLLDSAMNVARRSGAEVILLCLRPPSASPPESHEEERHFSALKSLQAQLHLQAIPASIEIIVGSVAQSMLDYLERDSSDMILVPGYQVTASASGREALQV